MSQRLKRWESPRQMGRNLKGRGGSARARQRKKQFQMLRQKLKEAGGSQPSASFLALLPAMSVSPHGSYSAFQAHEVRIIC